MAKKPVAKMHGGAGEVGFNMTPMIDCTFQLIIFFILASQIASAETAKGVKLPRPWESQSIPPKDLQLPNRLIINVVSADPRDEDPDKLAAANAERYEISNRQISVGDVEAIVEIIKNRKTELEARGAVSEGDEEKQFFIEIRADKRINWQDVAPVIRAGVEAGIRKMSVTALTEQK